MPSPDQTVDVEPGSPLHHPAPVPSAEAARAAPEHVAVLL